MKTSCHLCEKGFPLSGDNHLPTQSLGMIPVTRCRKKVKRGDIKRFRNFLNLKFSDAPKHRHGRFQQTKRQYGDYLYHQDKDKFEMEMCNWLVLPGSADRV